MDARGRATQEQLPSRRADPDELVARRVPPARHERRRRAGTRVLRGRPRRRRLRDRHPEGLDGDPREHEIPVSRRARRPTSQRRARCRLRHQRSRARVAAVVLPLEPRPRRDAARPRAARHAARAYRARAAGGPHARRRALALARHELRVPVARRAPARSHRPRSQALSELRRGPAPCLHEGDGALSRQHSARRTATSSTC